MRGLAQARVAQRVISANWRCYRAQKAFRRQRGRILKVRPRCCFTQNWLCCCCLRSALKPSNFVVQLTFAGASMVAGDLGKATPTVQKRCCPPYSGVPQQPFEVVEKAQFAGYHAPKRINEANLVCPRTNTDRSSMTVFDCLFVLLLHSTLFVAVFLPHSFTLQQ